MSIPLVIAKEGENATFFVERQGFRGQDVSFVLETLPCPSLGECFDRGPAIVHNDYMNLLFLLRFCNFIVELGF